MLILRAMWKVPCPSDCMQNDLHIGLKVRDMCLSPSLVTSINFLGEVIQARVSMAVVVDHESLLTQQRYIFTAIGLRAAFGKSLLHQN